MLEDEDREDTIADEELTGPFAFDVGSRIGRFIVIDILGKGGMGIVYKAYDPQLDRQVAIKLVGFSSKSSKSLARKRDRLLREARAMSQLSHPNVVIVYDVGTVDERVFIAMELVEGQTLKRWIAAHKPSVQEIVKTLIAAGRGLAAAHQQGLIHRDFKGDNVIVGSDGRVRVLDFGLARATQEYKNRTMDLAILDSNLSEDESDPSLGHSGDPMHSPLTEAGKLVGTPNYMAPEQFLDSEVDERADQFSFCVVLYESLFGYRPFRANSRKQLANKVIRGLLEAPPSDSAVPKWLRNIVMKGLSNLPQDRYASMDELLQELSHDPAQRRRRWLMVVGTIGLVLVSIWSIWGRRSNYCQQRPTWVDSGWNIKQVQKVQKAFQLVGRNYADDAFIRVKRGMAEYKNKLSQMHQSACEATRVHGTQSEHLLDLRMFCLSQLAKEMEELSEIFVQANADVVQKAVHAVSKLTAVDHCANTKRLILNNPDPADPATRQGVALIQRKLARTKALSIAGLYSKSVEIALAALADCQSLDYPAIKAKALFWLGKALRLNGDYDRAQERLTQSYLVAQASGMDTLVINAMSELVFLVGYLKHQTKPAHMLADLAKAVIQRIGGDDELLADLLIKEGSVFYRQGQFEKSLVNARRALEKWEKVRGPEDLHIAVILNNMGTDLSNQGRLELALKYHRRSMAIHVAALGESHPYVGMNRYNIGRIYHRQHNLEAAVQYYKKALEIWQVAHGQIHPQVSMAHVELGSAYIDQGRYLAARTHLEACVEIRTQCYGAQHLETAQCLAAQGSMYVGLGEYSKALSAIKQSLKSAQVSTLPPTFNTVRARLVQGEAHLGLGQILAAKKSYNLALQAVTEDVDRLVDLELARLHFGLAQVQWRLEKNGKRALQLAHQALAFAKNQADDNTRKLRTRIQRWITGLSATGAE